MSDQPVIATPLLKLELVVAALLLALAMAWNAWRHLELWDALQWSGHYGLLGLLAAVPPLMMIPLLELSWNSSFPVLRHLRQDIRKGLLPLLKHIRFAEALVLSCLAGLSEEVFFRGVLQREIGLVLASLIFGLFHALSFAYVLWATAMGGYLGCLANWSGNLWPSIVTHTVVDLVGFWYVRHIVAARLDHNARRGTE